jgi:5'-deoxynucleotidase YfbR-like HD superfamily hydrolase
MNPSDPTKIIEYPHDLAYDSDVIATQAHTKASEAALGHKFDPVPFLAVQQKYDSDDAQEAQALSDADSQPTSLAQASSGQKTAVKSQSKAKAEAKATAQTKAEKMTSFVAMRKRMMSNWGTK